MKNKTMNKFILYLIVVAVLIIAAIGIYGYFWYSDTTDKLEEAEIISEKAVRYDNLSEIIKKERVECLQFMAEESGNFKRFNYCEGFVGWSGQFEDL